MPEKGTTQRDLIRDDYNLRMALVKCADKDDSLIDAVSILDRG